jgi:hypothetical protein
VNECGMGGAGVTACGTGTCNNTVGNYTCTCAAGYAGTGTTSCGDVDECGNGGVGITACAAGSCANNVGSYACTCPTGYTGTGSTACTDLDECANGGVGATACGTGTCNNNVGSYACTCATGFSGTGTTACTDVNECANGGVGVTACGSGICTNNAGSYSCSCDGGYTGTGTTACTDVNECANGGVGVTACGPGSCSNTTGSYSCTCPTNYTGTGTTACTDVNECANGGVGVTACGVGSCTNTPGDYLCTCPAGYDGTGSDSCTDIDECQGGGVGETSCQVSMGGTCNNGPGTYACVCPGGFNGTGTKLCTGAITSGNLCDDVQLIDPNSTNGIYTLDPDGSDPSPSFAGYCNMTGGGWTQILDQDITVGSGYLPKATWAAGVTTTASNGGQWSALQHMANLVGTDGKYHFLLTWGSDEVRQVQWTQTGNPFVSRGTVSEIFGFPSDQSGFSGLGADQGSAALDGNPDGSWWWAVGSETPHNGAIPADSPTGTVSPRARLYVRSTSPPPRDCADQLTRNSSATDGVYLIDPDGPGAIKAFNVYCDMTNGGWTEISDQDVNVAPGYRNPTLWLAGVTDTAPNGGQWSALQHLAAYANFAGNYKFRMAWNEPVNGFVEWEQSLNPLVGRGTVGNVNMNPPGQTGVGTFAGLLAKFPTSPAALDGDSSGTGGWFWAVGSQAPYGSGIPAYGGGFVASRTRLYFKRP